MRNGFALRLDEFKRLRAAELAITAIDNQSERQLEIACLATDAALRRLKELPATDIPEAVAKLDAVVAVRDVADDVVEAISELRGQIVAFCTLLALATPEPGPVRAESVEAEPAAPPALLGRCARFRQSRWAFLEPWYDWGTRGALGTADDAEFDLYGFDLDWLGFALRLQAGRRPALAVAA